VTAPAVDPATLTFTGPHITGSGIHHWDLRGPAGLIRFEVINWLTLLSTTVYLHATRPPMGAELEDCATCGRCWHDCLATVVARKLWADWSGAGNDDAIIRERLTGWYGEHLAGVR
jgi:NAD-dependent dihydropyrimidine dehydrogenase PreA subunit